MLSLFTSLPNMLVLLFRKRSVLWALAKRDFQSGTQGTYMGIFWAYFQPMIHVIILTLVFSLGLRHNPAGQDVPFVVFLISGMVPWQFFSMALGGLTGIIKSHGYLIRKGDTPLLLLPVGHLISRLFGHGILLVIAVVVAWIFHIPPTILILQLLYYMGCCLILLLGLGLIACSTSLFIPDVSHLISVIIQFGFWMTPIIWNADVVPQKYHWIIKLNPMAYIVVGYRDSIMGKVPFWDHWLSGLYFWAITLFILFLGAFVFRRLKPHFGEVVS